MYYTYNIDNNWFFDNLISFLEGKNKTKEEENILSLIKGGTCFIVHSTPDRPEEPYRPIKPIPPKMPVLGISTPLSQLESDIYRNKLNNYQKELNLYRNEHNGYQKKLDFYNRYNERSVQVDAIIYFSISLIPRISKKVKNKLIEICNQLMPPETGYLVKNVEFKRLFKEKNNSEMKLDIGSVSNELSEKISEFLPNDIKEKGKEMAQVYLYLYCIENSLRLFIESRANEKYGSDYFNKMHVKTGLKNQIKSRKEDEEKNKWISLRGESEIFYLDFKDLENIIRNNKDIFDDYFPDDHWLSVKIKEMTKIRDRIAHNSFIGDHEISLLKNNYESILRQIGEKER